MYICLFVYYIASYCNSSYSYTARWIQDIVEIKNVHACSYLKFSFISLLVMYGINKCKSKDCHCTELRITNYNFGNFIPSEINPL